MPSNHVGLTPADFNTPFKDVRIQTPDGVNLQAWWLEHSDSNPNRPALHYSHGNGATLSALAHVASIFFSYGWNVLLYDYRGYGQSDPAPNGLSEEVLAVDATAAYSWLASKVPETNIVLWGHSLGSAVAARLSTTTNPSAMVLEGAFTSMHDMARYRFPWALILPFMLKDPFVTKEYVKTKNTPLLVMHSENDSIIPLHLGRKVYELANAPKKWLLIRGIDHNDFPSVEAKYSEEIKNFVELAIKNRSSTS